MDDPRLTRSRGTTNDPPGGHQVGLLTSAQSPGDSSAWRLGSGFTTVILRFEVERLSELVDQGELYDDSL